MKFNYKDLHKTSQNRVNTICNSFIDCLLEKPFNDITIYEICNKAKITRATFYNYYQDKYDVMNSIWEWIFFVISDEQDELSNKKVTPNTFKKAFDSLYDLFDKNSKPILKIANANNFDDYLQMSLKIFINSRVKIMLEKDLINTNRKGIIPTELLENFYTDVIFELIKWRFFIDNNKTSKAETYQILLNLIN